MRKQSKRFFDDPHPFSYLEGVTPLAEHDGLERKEMKKKNFKIKLALWVLIFLLSWGITAQSAPPKEIPVKGSINLVDFWSDYCMPCKMMAPVLAKVEKNYQGKVAIVHVDIEKFPDQVKRFGIRVVPTQVFFDQKGKEVFRHEGFMSEKEIGAQFKKMGVE